MADLTAVPTTLLAGDSYTLTLTTPDYPASAGWTLTFAVAGPSVDTWTSAASGDAHVITLPAADTAALLPGGYQSTLRASKGATVTTITRGTCAVEADVVTAAVGALETWAEKTLAIIEAVLANTATDAMKMYMIGGRQVMTHTLPELMALRAQLRTEVQMTKTRTFGTPLRFDVVGLR